MSILLLLQLVTNSSCPMMPTTGGMTCPDPSTVAFLLFDRCLMVHFVVTVIRCMDVSLVVLVVCHCLPSFLWYVSVFVCL